MLAWLIFFNLFSIVMQVSPKATIPFMSTYLLSFWNLPFMGKLSELFCTCLFHLYFIFCGFGNLLYPLNLVGSSPVTCPLIYQVLSKCYLSQIFQNECSLSTCWTSVLVHSSHLLNLVDLVSYELRTSLYILLLLFIDCTSRGTSTRVLYCRPAICARINYWNRSTYAKMIFAHLINYWNRRWVRRNTLQVRKKHRAKIIN